MPSRVRKMHTPITLFWLCYQFFGEAADNDRLIQGLDIGSGMEYHRQSFAGQVAR